MTEKGSEAESSDEIASLFLRMLQSTLITIEKLVGSFSVSLRTSFVEHGGDLSSSTLTRSHVVSPPFCPRLELTPLPSHTILYSLVPSTRSSFPRSRSRPRSSLEAASFEGS